MSPVSKNQPPDGTDSTRPPVERSLDPIPEPTAVEDAIGVLSAFVTKEVDTYAGMLEEILTEPMRAARLVSGLCHVASANIDRVAAHEGRDRWELVVESRHALQLARRSNHPAHRLQGE